MAVKLADIKPDPIVIKCFVHELGFTDPAEYEAHMAEVEHEHVGVAPCNQCGAETEFKWKGKLTGHTMPALCKPCKQKLLDGLQ